jgi:hypothetical protein
MGLALLARPGNCQPGVYASVMSRLKAASIHGRVPVYELGTSAEGRKIPMVVLGQTDAKTRVMVICRQHGDEPVSSEAAMHLIQRVSKGDSRLRQELKGVELLLVPLMNPDGAERDQRENGNGVDLNRDWRKRSQPETRALAQAFHRLRPQVVLDEHEWTLADRCGSNSLEVSPGLQPAAYQIQMGAAAAGNEVGVPLRATRALPGFDDRLAHRSFGAWGAAGFLLETTPQVRRSLRRDLYELMMIRMARMSALYAPKKAAEASVQYLPRLFPSVVAQRTARRPRFPWPLFSIAAFLFLVVAVQGLSHPVSLIPETQHKRKIKRALLRQPHDLEARFQRRRRTVENKSSRPALVGFPPRTHPIRAYPEKVQRLPALQPVSYKRANPRPLPLSEPVRSFRKAS